MTIQLNLRLLATKPLELEGEISADDLDISGLDELVQPASSISYQLRISRHEKDYLVEGRLQLELLCQCSRCLRTYPSRIDLDPWRQLLQTEGEDKILIVNDFVDLTPWVREDIVLAFPQHPLCGIGCSGLKEVPQSSPQKINGAREHSESVSAWAELEKLKF